MKIEEQELSSKERLTKCEYYYGISKEEMKSFKNMEAHKFLKHRILLAKILLKKLVDLHYLKQDTARINDIDKAIELNKLILEDLE